MDRALGFGKGCESILSRYEVAMKRKPTSELQNPS